MDNHDPLQPHSHDNNTTPPSDDPTIFLEIPQAKVVKITLADLESYPQTTYGYSYVTDHGPHGPYEMRGVALIDLISAEYTHPFTQVEVISADGFGNRIFATELTHPQTDPILLAFQSDGAPLTLRHGLVRLVVPSETDNALRQIKWVRTIRILPETLTKS